MSSGDPAQERTLPRGTSQNLAKQIFAADLPEQYIRTIPSQALFMALKRNGLQSSSDLIELASIEQCRLMIDFDCWNKSYFHEDNFWQWLALTSEDDDLSLLQKLLKCFDLKIIALLISRYVDHEVFEEPTDNPPAAGFYTPDKGRTWINIKVEDSERHFLLGRVLAMLFETNADLFYQLLALSGTQTPAVLEEEAYQDKTKRLAAEGIPDYDLAAAVNSHADTKEIRFLLSAGKAAAKIVDIQAVEPLIFDSPAGRLIDDLLRDIAVREDVETQLTYIMNAALIYWGVEFYEYEKMLHLTSKIKGAVNLGLEKAVEISGRPVTDVMKTLGLIKTYQFGLTQLKELRTRLKEIRGRMAPDNLTAEQQLVLTMALQGFPEIPTYLKLSDGKYDEDDLPALSPAPIEKAREIGKILSLFE